MGCDANAPVKVVLDAVVAGGWCGPPAEPLTGHPGPRCAGDASHGSPVALPQVHRPTPSTVNGSLIAASCIIHTRPPGQDQTSLGPSTMADRKESHPDQPFVTLSQSFVWGPRPEHLRNSETICRGDIHGGSEVSIVRRGESQNEQVVRSTRRGRRQRRRRYVNCTSTGRHVTCARGEYEPPALV